MEQWVDNSPTKYGFAAGTRRLDMILAMLFRELNVKCKPRTLRRVMDRAGCSYMKPRPIAAARNTRSPAPLPPPTTFRGVVA